MLRYVYGADLPKFPTLRDTMFRDRAAQFRDRLGWAVSVDAAGFERDGYDAKNPLYAIWETPEGRHGGSMRMLPTTGETMMNDVFSDLAGAEIRHPLIWECTRLCLAEGAGPKVSAALLVAVLEAGLAFHLTDVAGVFDSRMVRIYRRIGWEPTVLGTRGTGRAAISLGLWQVTPKVRPALLRNAGITGTESRRWFDLSFGAERQGRRAAAG